MKRIILLFCGILMLATQGCNYLDVVPDDTATLADAFKNESTTEAFLFTLYSYQYEFRNWRNIPGRATTNEMVAESRWGDIWFPFKLYNTNQVGSSNLQLADIWASNYTAIRQCYIFLDNVDNAKPDNISADAFESLKNRWKGEAKFLIAWYHHLLFQHYGPIVLVDGITNVPQPRMNIDACVDKIAGWYDEAAALLPATVGSTDYGRATKMAALAMKAKLLLYAASPLFNGDPEGVFADAVPEFKSLMNLQRNNAKWDRALTAIDEAINFAETSGGRTLYKHIGADPVAGKPATITPDRQAYLNVRELAVTNWNSEVIWGYTGSTPNDPDEWERHVVPGGMGGRSRAFGQPVGGLAPSLAAVKIFYSSTGMPLEQMNDAARGYSWTAEGRMTIPAGANTCNLHLNREPRFYAAIGYDGGIYEYNGWTENVTNFKCGTVGQVDISGLYIGSSLANSIANQDRLETGYAVKKNVSPSGVAGTASADYTPVRRYAWCLIRLGDLYLQYAEACAEAKGSLDAKAQEYIKRIHDRAGLDGSNFYYKNYNGTQLVEAVRRERMIELIFESQWHYDLRRWEMADKWFNNGMWASAGYSDKNGMWGLSITGVTAADFYKEVNSIAEGYRTPYVFDKRMYFLPISINYININGLLVQNPGY
jgi:hypothetical protein